MNYSKLVLSCRFYPASFGVVSIIVLKIRIIKENRERNYILYSFVIFRFLSFFTKNMHYIKYFIVICRFLCFNHFYPETGQILENAP